MAQTIRIAACHVSPIFLSARDTTHKALSLVEQAAKNRANLVVFPETYIPAFPIWSALRPPTANHDFFKQMTQESVYADGHEIDAMRSAAKKWDVMISVGISEKVRSSSATLFNSNLIIDNRGEVKVHHRKLMPTFFEKLTWSPGDGYGLRVAETKFGKIGNLICGENTNPLARYALMAQGEQIHLSTWPCIWPTRVSHTSSNESTGSEEADRELKTVSPRNYDNVAANRTRAAAHCFEAKAFGVVCSGVLGQDAIDAVSSGFPSLTQVLQGSQRGATMFLDPTGTALPGFTVDPTSGIQETTEFLQATEDILYADMNVANCIEGKQYHDVVGGYQRMDVFNFGVNRTRHYPAKFTDDPPTQPVEPQQSPTREEFVGNGTDNK